MRYKVREKSIDDLALALVRGGIHVFFITRFDRPIGSLFEHYDILGGLFDNDPVSSSFGSVSSTRNRCLQGSCSTGPLVRLVPQLGFE